MPENGTADDTSERTTVDGSADRVRRRDVLRTTGTVGIGALAAGNVSATSSDAEYVADPMGFHEEKEPEGFRLLDHRGVVEETAEGVPYESVLTAYGGEPRYGLFSTPDLEREGHEPSEPVQAGPEHFLETDAGRGLLATLNVGREYLEWTEGPHVFAENPGSREPILLDREVEMLSLVGAVNETEAVLAHVGMVRYEGNVVFAVDARTREWDGERELLGDEEAIFQKTDQPKWADLYTVINRYPLPLEPIPDCLSPLPDPFSPTVEITHPPNDEVVRTEEDGVAILTKSGETAPIGEDGLSVVIEPEASVDGCYDELRWTYRSVHEFCPDPRPLDDGTGESTEVELQTCGCSGAKYTLEVEALDEQGEVIGTDVHVILVHLLICL